MSREAWEVLKSEIMVQGNRKFKPRMPLDPEYMVLNINIQVQTNIRIHIFCKVKKKTSERFPYIMDNPAN